MTRKFATLKRFAIVAAVAGVALALGGCHFGHGHGHGYGYSGGHKSGSYKGGSGGHYRWRHDGGYRRHR